LHNCKKVLHQPPSEEQEQENQLPSNSLSSRIPTNAAAETKQGHEESKEVRPFQARETAGQLTFDRDQSSDQSSKKMTRSIPASASRSLREKELGSIGIGFRHIFHSEEDLAWIRQATSSVAASVATAAAAAAAASTAATSTAATSAGAGAGAVKDAFASCSTQAGMECVEYCDDDDTDVVCSRLPSAIACRAFLTLSFSLAPTNSLTSAE